MKIFELYKKIKENASASAVSTGNIATSVALDPDNKLKRKKKKKQKDSIFCV